MGFHSLTTSTQIANLALQRIGEKTITLITDSNERAQNVSLVYQFELDKLTAKYKWRFARKSITIDLPTSSITVFADHSGTVIGTVLATDTGHPYVTGETVNIFDGCVGSYDGDRVVTRVDDNSYYFTADFVSTETATARWTSDAYEWRFAIPTDLTDIIKIGTGIEDYAVQGIFIVTSAIDDNLILLYDQKIGDVSLMPTYFIDLLKINISVEIASRRIGDNVAVTDRLELDKRGIDSEARRLDRGQDFEEDQGAFTILGVNAPNRTAISSTVRPIVRQNNG